MFKTYNI